MIHKTMILDGAWGTELWKKAEERGITKTSVWQYNLTHPEMVTQLCREYKEAGSDIICTNTFGANALSIKRESSSSVKEVVEAAVAAAKEALAGTGVKIALDIGPLPMLMEPYGDLEEDEVSEIYKEIIDAGVGAGCDCIFLETFLQLEMLSAAAQEAVKTGLPVFCSMSFEAVGKTLFGVSVEDMIEELEPLGIHAIGMNCSLGPDTALPIIRTFAEKTDLPLFFKPNAGKPVVHQDGTTSYDVTPEAFASQAGKALETGRIKYLGGCCGTDPAFIKELKKLVE